MEEETARVRADKTEALKALTQVAYLLYAFSYFSFGVTALIAIGINYWKLEETSNTWLESHFSSQISIFWHCSLWALMGWLTMILYVGYVVFIASFVWMLYRVVVGWRRLQQHLPMLD